MLVAVDFETYLIDKTAIFPKPVCLSAFNGTEAFLFRGQEMFDYLDKALEEDTIIAHNAVFECGVIIKHFPSLQEKLFNALDEDRIVCTKINEELLDNGREKKVNRYNLAHLVQHYFNEDISAGKGEDAWRMRYSELENVEHWPQEAIDYAIDDSIWAYKVHQRQGVLEYKLAVKAAVYLNLIGSTGMLLDNSRVDILKKEVTEYLQPRYNYLIEHDLCVFDKGKHKKQMKKLAEYISDLEIDKRYTAKGNIKVDGESLDNYLAQLPEDKVLKTFYEISKYEKILSAYLNRMSETDVIYTQYSTTKTSGRSSSNSSSLFPSMNIQQMPRQVPNVSYDVRNCFIPRKGFKLLSIDYAGLELCSTAHQLYKFYNRSKMRDLLNQGDEPTDMHSMLAARLQHVTYEEFIKNKAKYKDVRQKAKPINLGFPGGIGYEVMRNQLWKDGIKTQYKILHTEEKKRNLHYFLHQLSRPDLRIARTKKNEYALVQDELVLLKRQFFDLYPELEWFLKEGHLKFQDGGVRYVKNDFDEWEEEPTHTYTIAGYTRTGCTYTALCNGYLMQTPAAIGAQHAVCKIVNKYYNHPDVQPLAFIHDELVFEIKEDRKDIVENLAYMMIDEMKKVLSSVRITVEASMMDQWQKEDGFWTEKYWK